MATFTCTFLLLVSATLCSGHKILVIFPFPTKSHNILGNGVVKHLLNAGNEVTYVTPYPRKDPPPGLKQIDLSSLSMELEGNQVLNVTGIMENPVNMNDMTFLFQLTMEIARKAVRHENIHKLMMDRSQRFDAVVAEWMLTDIYSGFAQVFHCPYILFNPFDATSIVLEAIDELPNPAYTPSMLNGHLPPLNFMERIQELYVQLKEQFLKHVYFNTAEISEYESVFIPVLNKLGLPLLPYDEVKNNISLALVNTHVSLGYAARIPQNYLPIGGYHIDSDVKPLPKDLQDLMDNAKNGVIYFSLGTNLKSKDLPEKVKTNLLKMFGSLKQTVIWKFEETLRNVPKNVKLMKWAPQPSILSHPSCLLFISHGGLLSTTETIHFGVPIIGIPVFVDQHRNVDLAVNKGFAKRVDLSYTIADDLKEAIVDILSNSKYTEKAKELSLIYHHRPTTPGQLLAHGVEHVILSKGALHLRSPQSMTPWYQKLYLDLLAVVFTLLALVIYTLKQLLSVVFAKKITNVKKRS